MTPAAPANNTARNPWLWIPSLYYGQGLPFAVVMAMSVIMYKNLGVSTAEVVFYTSWLYLPWVIKPLWSPLVDMFHTKRAWIISTQFVIGIACAMIAFTLPGPDYFRATLAVFWLMAFNSATYDIAADGFYMLALPVHQQAAFVGVRSALWRLAMISGQGGLVYLAGSLATSTGNVVYAWTLVFFLLTAVFGAVGLYHIFVLPKPAADRSAPRGDHFFRDFLAVFAAFFRKPGIGVTLAFLLLYRFAESQALRLIPFFLLDKREIGGLGLTTQQVGIVYGTVGVIALTLGTLLGGWVISRVGLKRMLWPMICLMNVPTLVFVFLAVAQPGSLWVISASLAVEQFGYGFGFAAYLLYMLMVSEGEHKTAHYAICTGFMALGMMLPGMPAGWLQEQIGYVNFFLWVMLATIPSFAATALIKIDPAFGRKA